MSVLAWRWCALAGLATLVVAVLLGRVPGLTPCGGTSTAGAVIALELARSAADVTALFGSEPCTSRLIAAQRHALWIDMLAFIPAYGVFLLSAVMALRGAGLGMAMFVFNLFMIAVTLDFLEGAILFKLLANLPGEARQFTGLYWMVRPKFALLGVGEIALALMLWRGAAPAKIAAGVIAAGGVVALTYLFRDPHDPAMMTGHTVAWSALLVVAVIGAVRPAALGLPTGLPVGRAVPTS